MFDISEIFRNGGGLGSGSQLDRQRGEILDDPAPSWRYIVRWPSISPKYNDDFVRDNIVAERISFPFTGTSPIGRHAGATMTFFPDFQETQGFSASFYLDHKHSSLGYFLSWKKALSSSNGDYFEANFYKHDVEVSVFSNDNSETPVTRMIIEGVWAADVNPIELAYENSERLILEVTFSVDSSKVIFAEAENDRLNAESILQRGQSILRTGRRGLREIRDISRLF